MEEEEERGRRKMEGGDEKRVDAADAGKWDEGLEKEEEEEENV